VTLLVVYTFYTSMQSFPTPTCFNTSVYECPETGTDVPQHVGVAKDYTDVFTIYLFVLFYKKIF
jgi:hypothetical protein